MQSKTECPRSFQLASIAPIDAEDRGIPQRRTDTSGYRSMEAAGEKNRGVVAAVVLDVVLELAQERDQGFLLVSFLRRCGRPSMGLRGQGRVELVDGPLHRLELDRRRWESRVAGQTGDNAPGSSCQLFCRLASETSRNANVLKHSRISFACFIEWFKHRRRLADGFLRDGKDGVRREESGVRHREDALRAGNHGLHVGENGPRGGNHGLHDGKDCLDNGDHGPGRRKDGQRNGEDGLWR
jgi:hypothetical protein